MSANENKSSYCVKTFVLPTAGDPSATEPFPINISLVSIAQPISPDESCGSPEPAFFLPLRTCILDICTTAIKHSY